MVLLDQFDLSLRNCFFECLSNNILEFIERFVRCASYEIHSYLTVRQFSREFIVIFIVIVVRVLYRTFFFGKCTRTINLYGQRFAIVQNAKNVIGLSELSGSRE